MLHVGRGCKDAGGSAGVTVSAAVAILERRQEEQRRTAPSAVRHLQRGGDLNSRARPGVLRDSSDSSVGSIGETIARLKSRFCVSGVGSSAVSCSAPARDAVRDAAHTSMKKHGNSLRRNELTTVNKRDTGNYEVKTNHVATDSEGSVGGIRKSPSTKNISSLVRNNSAVPARSVSTLSSSDSKPQDLRKCFGYDTPDDTCKGDISPVQCEETLEAQHKFGAELSNVRRSISTEDVVDQHADFNDDGLGATTQRSGDLRTDAQVAVKYSTSDSNIPRKRPRVIHLRDAVTKNGISKGSPEVASRAGEGETEVAAPWAGPPQARNSSAKIVLEYPPPPPSPPPELEGEDVSGSSLTGGSSPSNSARIVASAESLGTRSMTRAAKRPSA